MRRSFASHLEAAGGNATDALQHSSRRVTKESYLDERIVKSEAPNRLLFDIVPNVRTGPPPLPKSKATNGVLGRLFGRNGSAGNGKEAGHETQ